MHLKRRHSATMDPGECLGGSWFVLGRLFLFVHGSLGKLAVTLREFADVFALLLGRTRQSFQVLQVPTLDQVVDDIGVVDSSVDAARLGDIGKVTVQVWVDTIRHLLGRHGDLTSHHVAKDGDETIGIALQNFFTEQLVGLLVTTFVSSNLGADLGQVLFTVLTSNATNITVRDLGSSFLE